MDLLQILSNTALHFVFFGVNLILLPALVIRLTESYSSSINRNSKIGNIRNILRLPLDLALMIVLLPVWLIFGNFKENVNSFKSGFNLGAASKTDLDIETAVNLVDDFFEKLDLTPPIYSFWKQIGFYIDKVICLCAPSAVAILMVYWLLPNTYAAVAANIDSWIAFKSGTPNLAFFTDMALTFKSIIWDGFIWGALNENILYLVLIIVVSIFVLGLVKMNMLYVDAPDYSGNIYADEKSRILDENGKVIVDERGIVHKTKRIFFKTWKCLPTLAIVLLAFNFIFAFINYQAYVGVAGAMNSVGMVVLLVLLVQIILTLIFTCPKMFINFVKNKIGI